MVEVSPEFRAVFETTVADLATDFLTIGAAGVFIGAGIYTLVTGWRFIKGLI